MTTGKKNRYRGSRTHGGGTHKNRRGAGNRGGRGGAGRSKHEMQNHPPLGKHGFTPPAGTQATVETVNIQRLDEDTAILAADGLAEQKNGYHHIDVRDVAEDGYEVDQVKVLGNGQVRQKLHVVADRFSVPAKVRLENAGGDAELSDRGYLHEKLSDVFEIYDGYNEVDNIKASDIRIESMNDNDQEYVRRRAAEVSQGLPLKRSQVTHLLGLGDASEDPGLLYDISVKGYQNKENLLYEDVIELYQMNSYAKNYGFDTDPVEELLGIFFADMDTSEDTLKNLGRGIEGTVSAEDAKEGLTYLEDGWDNLKQIAAEKEQDLPDKRLQQKKKTYLLGIRNSFERYA